jgi:CDGSH-type Zn-finger protein
MAIDKKKPKIKVTENGPYLVSGNMPLKRENSVPNKEGIPERWESRGKIASEESYLLCRCGRSKNKPFCDHSHAEAHFDGTETAKNLKFDEQAKTYDGPTLILKDAEDFCSIARFCDLGKRVWYLVEGSDDPADKKLAAEEACNCPSGRLVVYDKKTGKKIEPKFKQEISITEDLGEKTSGPIWVKGGIPIVSANGKKYETRNRVTLCRCGQSRNKPFCDGTHLNIGFIDENNLQ